MGRPAPDPVGRLGSSDCERLRPRPPYQPVNTASSAGLALAGLGVLGWAAGRPDVPRGTAAAYAAAVVVAGLGSVDYHGWQTRHAQWTHDLGVVLPLLVAAGHDLTVVRRLPPGRALGAAGVAAGVAGLVLAIRPGWGPAVAGLAAAVLGPLEVAAWRRDRPDPAGPQPRRKPRRRAARRVLVAALAVGAGLQLTGRTGGPACRPDSPWQGHAGWHLAAAAALAAWAVAALPADG